MLGSDPRLERFPDLFVRAIGRLGHLLVQDRHLTHWTVMLKVTCSRSGPHRQRGAPQRRSRRRRRTPALKVEVRCCFLGRCRWFRRLRGRVSVSCEPGLCCQAQASHARGDDGRGGHESGTGGPAEPPPVLILRDPPRGPHAAGGAGSPSSGTSRPSDGTVAPRPTSSAELAINRRPGTLRAEQV